MSKLKKTTLGLLSCVVLALIIGLLLDVFENITGIVIHPILSSMIVGGVCGSIFVKIYFK